MKKLGHIICVNEIGFTMVEMLVGIALSSIVLTSLYATYSSQQKTYNVEQQKAALQQSVRSAMYYLERDLRRAGCDPTGAANVGFQLADNSTVQLTMDITGGEADGKDNDKDGSFDEADENKYADGNPDDSDENLTYQLTDADTDGDTDIVRNGVILAENIDALNFVYLDGAGLQLATPVADMSQIRAVQITIIARADKTDQDYTDSSPYSNLQGTVVLASPNDRYRRRMLSCTVRTRNIGM